MESTLTDILALIHTREMAIENELKTLRESKRLLAPLGAIKDTGRAANGEAEEDIPEVGGGWSAARRARHSRMMKKRWAARKRVKK